jgi:phage tail-like protein
MAVTRALSSDPLRSFKFNVSIPLMLQGGNGYGEARLGFMSASGLGVSIEPLTYREGGDNLTDLPIDALVLTTEGWKPMGEIQIGDRVIDPCGKESKVTEKSTMKQRDVYAVTLGDGTVAEASDRHIWQVDVRDTNGKRFTARLSTLEMKSLAENPNRRVLIPSMEPFVFEAASDLPIDPYLMGILLSEGSLEQEGVSFAHGEATPEILDRVRSTLPEGHVLKPKYNNGKLAAWRISVGNDGPGTRNVYGRNKILCITRDLGLMGHRAWEKFIPDVYKFSTYAERLALLQGIMDGDGWVDHGGCTQLSLSSKQLLEDVKDLIVSLGGRSGRTVHHTDQTYRYKGETVPCRDKYQFSGITGLQDAPFSLQRKADLFVQSLKTDTQFRSVKSVELVGKKTVQCIEVSADSHLFVHANVCSSNTRKMPGQADFNPITLSRGMFPSDSDNWYWMTNLFTAMYGNGVNPLIGGSAITDFRTHMYINILEHPNNTPAAATGYQYESSYTTQPIVKVSFLLYSAWIGSLAYSDLDAGGNAVAVEQMTINYEGFDMQWGGAGYVQDAVSWM